MGAAAGTGPLGKQGTNQALLVAFPVLRGDDLQADDGGVHGVAEHFLGSGSEGEGEEGRKREEELFGAFKETVEGNDPKCAAHISEIYC